LRKFGFCQKYFSFYGNAAAPMATAFTVMIMDSITADFMPKRDMTGPINGQVLWNRLTGSCFKVAGC